MIRVNNPRAGSASLPVSHGRGHWPGHHTTVTARSLARAPYYRDGPGHSLSTPEANPQGLGGEREREVPRTVNERGACCQAHSIITMHIQVQVSLWCRTGIQVKLRLLSS
jgi:hypothetical protein